MSYGVKLHVWGPFALFARPEFKVERVSYDFLTPSAARGVLEAIYWKPEIRWVIRRLHVLAPIRYSSLRRNEVGAKISAGTALGAMRVGRGNLGLYIELERQQRASLILRDVAYMIEAEFRVIGGEPNEAKHLDTFNRRARRGQCWTRPYLGCREFAADFALADEDRCGVVDASLKGNRDFGWMLHDIDYANDRNPRFFHAVMVDGVVEVPPFEGKEVTG